MGNGGEDDDPSDDTLLGEPPRYGLPTRGKYVNQIIGLSISLIVIGLIGIVLIPVENGPLVVELLESSPGIFAFTTGIVAVWAWLKNRE